MRAEKEAKIGLPPLRRGQASFEPEKKRIRNVSGAMKSHKYFLFIFRDFVYTISNDVKAPLKPYKAKKNSSLNSLADRFHNLILKSEKLNIKSANLCRKCTLSPVSQRA